MPEDSDSINTLIGTFSALSAVSLSEQTMEQCICIDTSGNRIGINTLGPSYAIDISNVVGSTVTEAIRTPRLLVTDKIGINTLDPSYAIDISNLVTGQNQGIRTPRLLVTDKIGIHNFDPSYAIDISNVANTPNIIQAIRTPRLFVTDKIGINNFDPSYAIDISNVGTSGKSYIRTPRLIISDISKLTFVGHIPINYPLVSGEIYVDASNYLRLR